MGGQTKGIGLGMRGGLPGPSLKARRSPPEGCRLNFFLVGPDFVRVDGLLRRRPKETGGQRLFRSLFTIYDGKHSTDSKKIFGMARIFCVIPLPRRERLDDGEVRS